MHKDLGEKEHGNTGHYGRHHILTNTQCLGGADCGCKYGKCWSNRPSSLQVPGVVGIKGPRGGGGRLSHRLSSLSCPMGRGSPIESEIFSCSSLEPQTIPPWSGSASRRSRVLLAHSPGKSSWKPPPVRGPLPGEGSPQNGKKGYHQCHGTVPGQALILDEQGRLVCQLLGCELWRRGAGGLHGGCRQALVRGR